MPHSPAHDSPLLTVTGNTLVLAWRYDARFDPRSPPETPRPPRTSRRIRIPRPPRTSRRRVNPYARLFAIPGARAFTGWMSRARR